jgi:hypothetical protein
MKLPSSSKLRYVAYLRHIQSIHESAGRRNPDTLVRHFIPIVERLHLAWISRAQLAKLREKPIYYYLVARTKYYDQVVEDAVSDGVKRIATGLGEQLEEPRLSWKYNWIVKYSVGTLVGERRSLCKGSRGRWSSLGTRPCFYLRINLSRTIFEPASVSGAQNAPSGRSRPSCDSDSLTRHRDEGCGIE